MVVITYGPTLADRVLAILPGDSDAALTTADLGKLLPGERRSEISLVCHRLMKWRLVAFRGGMGVSRNGFKRACNFWWRI